MNFLGLNLKRGKRKEGNLTNRFGER